MTFDKQAYWEQRSEEKAFRELFWMWRRECIKRFGVAFINRNASAFTQRSFRSILEQYASVEEAKQQIFTPENDLAPVFVNDATSKPQAPPDISEVNTTVVTED